MTATLGLTPSSFGSPYVASSGVAGLGQLTDLAIQQPNNASILASFGTTAGTPVTYTAADLLNSYLQAGTGVSVDTFQSNLADLLSATKTGVPVTSSELAVASGECTNSAGSSTDTTTANWTAALKSNPTLAYQVVADNQNQNLISAFSVFA